MSKERRPHPIVRTYVTLADDLAHVRITSRPYAVDVRGTGRTVPQAVRRALAKLPVRK
jgi:hypothetical protein